MLNGRNREIIDFAGRVSDVSKRMGYSAGLLLLFLLSLTSLPVEAQSNIQPAQPAFNLRRIYVSPEGAGTFDGSSWANAAKGSDLQMILRSTDTWNAINSTLQIWIAAGTYVPTEPLLPGDEQSASFVLKGNQVVVYGGFRGQVFDDLGALVYEGENSLEEREYGNVYSGDRQEPWALKNQTILSGDRLRNDVVGTDNMFSSLDPTQNTTRTDNLHTVVTFDPSSVDVMLDGITIVGGSADGDGNSGRGGGVSLDGIGCGIQRCLFYFNFASKGGAVYMHKNSGSDSQPCFVYNSVLVSNSAFRRDGFGYGGGIYSEAGVVFDNVVYNNNGGGICVYDETSIVNNTIVNNQLYGIGRPADTDVAGSSISVSNSVIWSINPLNHAGLKGFDALVDRVSNCAIVDWDETKGNDNISLLPYNDHTGSVPNFINPTTQIGAILEPVYADLGVSFLLRQNSVLLSKAEGSWMTTLNTYYGTDVSYDIAGKPRIVSKTLDIGAYQYQPVSGRNILYVRQLSPDEPPLADGEVRDGSTWRLAVQDVQMAIDQLYARNVVGEVWVAGGTYYPTAAFTDESGIRGRTERHRSFIMRSGISVYGGFRGQTGDEGINNSTTRPRDPDHLDVQWAFANRTIFSGDVDRNDDSQKGWRWNAGEKKWEQYYGRNSYHVVWFASEGFNERTTKYEAVTAKPLPVETTLDGVVVTGGCADYGERGESTRMGGGIYLTENGVVSNCIVYQNFALTRGGGVMMNNGGMLVNSMVFRNASPGVQVRNGLGGGVYILGNGTVFRTVITNNTARVGGGVYVDEAEYNNPAYEESLDDMYRGVLVNTLVSNNTSSSDAGAVYFDKLGGLSSSTVVKNYCSAVASDQEGNSGGMIVDGYGIVYNSVLWGNATLEHTRQFYGKNGKTAESNVPASIQVYNTALQNLSNTIWGVNTVTQKTYALSDQNSKGRSSIAYDFRFPDFTNVRVGNVDVINNEAGVYQTTAADVEGTQTLDNALRTIYDVQRWVPSEFSALQRKGGSQSEAPYVRYAPVKTQFYVAMTDILSKAFVEPRVLGAFASDRPSLQYSVIEDNGVKKLVIFVDPSVNTDLSGESWESPIISGNSAIEYLAGLPDTEYPGCPREIWVKEGTINPVWKAIGSDRRTSSVVLRGGVSLYGGFNSKLEGTEGSTVPGQTFVPTGSDVAEPIRNPVDFRTVFDGTLAGGNLYHVVTMSDDGEAILDGFHIVNGDASTGSSAIKTGGGVLHEYGTLHIRNCMIENNVATNGAGIVMLGTTKKLVMTNTVVNNNTNTGLSSESFYSAITLTNDARLNHCTIIHNNAPGICAVDGQLRLYNSVLWGNTSTGTIAPEDVQITGSATMLDIRNNAIQYAPEEWNLWSENMQLSIVQGDPMYPSFVNSTRNVGAISSGYDTPLGGPARFEPTCKSPLVIAGDESIVDDPDLVLDADITGHNFAVGGAPDIGAYEATCLNPVGSVLYVRSGPTGTASSPQTSYFGTGDGSSWANAACEAKLQKALNWAGYIIHNKETYASGRYRDITRIQVRIAKGTYYPTDVVLPDQPRTASFIIPAGIEVYGGFAGISDDETVDGRNMRLNRTFFNGMIGSSTEESAYRVVTFGMKQHKDNATMPAEGAAYYDDPNPEIALLNGIYIVYGNANHPSDEEWQSGGGVKVTSNGLLQNCAVFNCAASDKGGGVYLAPGGRITGSIVYNNVGANGGGIYADDSSMVVNCTVVDNTTVNNGSGGGISIGVKPIIINSVFWMNDSGNGKNIYGNMSQQVDTTFTGVRYQNYIFNHCAVEGIKVVGFGNMALTSTNENTSTIVGLNAPGFTDPDNLDFTLKRVSALIRAGIGAEQPGSPLMEALHVSRLDLLGTNRFYKEDSSLRDYFEIGAFAYDGIFVIDPAGDTEAEKGADGIYRLYVSQTAQGLANGRSWRNALGDIQQALDYFGNDANFEHDPNKDTRRCEIWVSKGTYNPKTSVKEDNWGTSFILNRYSSIYGGFRGSNLPYYESWIESFKVEPSKRVDATGVWNKGDYSYTLGGNGEITFYPEVKALEDEPSSWFLHFTTDEKSPSSPVVTVNGFQLPHELELPVIATDSTTEYIYDLRYLAIGNTDWATAPVIEAVRVSGLPAGVKLYSATIDNRKNSTTVSTEILDTDILHQTSTGVPYDASVSLNNLSQAEKSNTYSSNVSDYYAAGNSAGAYGMHYCPSSNWASITVSGNDGVVLTNERERVLWWYNYFNPSLGAYFRFPQAVKYERTNPSNRYLHATIHITDLSKGNEDGRLRIQLYSTAGVRKSLLINGRVSNGEYKLTVDLKTGLVYDGTSSVEITDEENTLSNGDMLSLVSVHPYSGGKAAYTVEISDITIDNKNQLGNTVSELDINIVTEEETQAMPSSDQYYEGEAFLSERPRQDWNGNGLLEDFEYANETILSGDIGGGSGNSHVAYYEDSEATRRVVLDGIKMVKGNSSCTDHGGGALCALAPIALRNCQLLLNTADFGGGAVYASDIEIYGSILGGNEAPGKSGGAVYLREGGKSLIVNTVIYNNTASTGSAYYAESGSTSQLINNTIVRNAYAENVSGDVTSGSTVYSASTAGNNLTNTVIWGNDDAERINADHWEIITSAADVDEDAGNFEVFLDRANEAVMGPRFGFPSDYAGAGNYFASADFSLPSLSTLVNRGTNGGTRRLNTVIEMNPDGSVKSTTITTEPVVLDGSGKGYYAVQKVSGRENVPDTLNNKWRITKEPDTYHIIKKDGVDMIDVKEWKEGTIDIGAYEYETVSLTPFGGNILYVKSSEAVSDKENNGETWERATSNIHQAIQVLLLSPNKKDKYIKIASGDYVPFLQDGTSGYSFVLEKPDVGNLEYSTKSLTLRGGYPNNITGTDVAMDNLRDPILYPTYIRGNRNDSKHLVYIDESMDTAGENGALAPVNIEGFTFVGGNAADATGEGSTGAAVYAANGSTTIRNSVFVDNTAAGEKGAAVYLNKGNIYNTVLHSNKAWGLALNGTGNIVSNTIADNSKGGLYARGALVAEPLQIYNNIFWRNYTSAVPTVGDLNNQIDVQNATLYSNAVQVDDATAEQPNAEYVYWNSSAGVVLGDKAANINKTLSSDNEDMSYGPRFEAPDEATPLDKKYNIRPGRKLINTGYRYMTGDSYNKAENDKWYTDLFAYYPFGSVEEPVAPGDSLARVMFVDAGGNRRIAGNSIDIGAYEYQRLFYPNLYVKPNGFGLGSSWDDAMGDLQEAIYSAYYSGDPEESGTYGTVWVAGGDYVLPTTLQWMANVKVYGGFRGTNETKLTQRPGLLEKNAPESILSVEAEGVPVVRSDNDRAAGTIVENWVELNGFHITGSKNSPAVIVADSFAIVNSVIYNNVNPDGAVVKTDGLLYNVLVHDNTVKEGSAAVALDEHAAAIHVTAPGEGAQIGGTGKIINTINGEVTSVSGNAYSPLYVGDYITDDTHLRYQLSDQKDAVLFGIGALQETGVDHEGNPVTTIGGYTVPKIRNGKEYTDIIDLSTDCDVLGNVRLFTDKFHGEGEVIRPDYGCFETWNTTPQKVVNVSDNYYPHAGSVVYVGKESEVRLTDALTKDFAPSYLLLHHAAGLRTGEHAVSLYNLAIERDLKPLINDTTASWDMVSLPFSLEVGNGTMLNGVTIDGLPVEAIQAGDESGDDKNRLYLYEYDGAKRAEDLYSVVAPQNSKYWAFENNQMGANVGYLMATPSASDAVTVRFSKSSSALPVYEESAEEGKSILLKQHNLKTLVGGRPHFTYKENMGWNLFGVPYLCSYTTERMSIDHILYTYDPEASRFVSINSWEGNTIAPFSAVFTQTATVKESEELLFAKPVIPLNTLPAPHGVQLKISGSNLSAGCDYVSVIADNVYGEPMNFDMGNDALKMMSFDPRIPQIYVYNEKGVRFAHTQTADIEGETPVGIYTGESGIYEISLTEDSEYDRYDAVVLTDRSTGRKVDLKHAPYSFTVDDRAMETGRFSLSFKTLSDEMQQPTFYSPGKRQLRIVNLQGGESIGIYDTLGRQRASRKAYGESEEFELESGVYMIRIEGSSLVKGKVVVK